MKHALATFCLAALFCAAGFSQSTFEAADVHVSTDKSPFLFMKGPFVRNGMFDARTASMVDLIGKAYGVENDKVIGGPSWLEMDHFDVMARIPANSTPESRKTMLQALLAERFRLVVHPDTKPVAAYALTASKHPMLRSAAAGSGETGCKFDRQAPPAPAPGAPRVPPSFTGTCRNITMAAFAEGMHNMPANYVYIGENRVADQTGLEGAWDFDFKYTQRNPNFSAADTITLFDALEKQLGLKLEPAEVPMPVLVVDSVNRTPSPNIPNIADILHVAPLPTEFEVAAVKPTDPDKKGMNYNIKPGGRLDISGFTLKSLIEEAWDINDNDMVVGLAKWMDEDRFDVVAKASTAAVIDSADHPKEPDIDWDAMQVMMRNLLADKFKLAVHMEERSVSAYTLMAGKPKMKKADPASRTLFKEGPATLMAKDPRVANPTLARLVTVQNMTMAQFASRLQNIAPGYIHTPVLDATGLEGSFDFTLSFTPVGLNRATSGSSADGAQPASVTPQASDPNNTGLTLPEAIEKQIGLKLVLQKRPVQVLVIDHAEQKPDN